MAVSTEFLAYLDYVNVNHTYDDWNTDELLDELESEWGWLTTYWRNEKLDAIDCLLNLATVSYQLLARLTYQSIDDIIAAARELHRTKNAGYSPNPNDAWANFRLCESFGIFAADGCLVRLSDKYTRFWNVYRDSNKDQVGESAVDTLRDLGAYCLILVVLLEEKEEN